MNRGGRRRGGAFLVGVRRATILFGFAVLFVACDETKPVFQAPAASATASASAMPELPPKREKGPEALVDAQGVYAGGERVNMSLDGAEKRLRDVFAGFDWKGKAVTVTALRNARTADVAAALDAIAVVGASSVTVKTQDRAHKETSLAIVPGRLAGNVPACTVIVIVQKDRSTASWTFRGGTATRYSRGMAGPDMSSTLDGVTRQVNACPSTAIAFSADESVEWGLAFDLGLALTTAVPPLKTTTLILPRDPPVAGKSIRTGGD